MSCGVVAGREALVSSFVQQWEPAVRVARDEDARAGVLEREKEINKIQEELKANKEIVAEQEKALESAREELQQAEARLLTRTSLTSIASGGT